MISTTIRRVVATFLWLCSGGCILLAVVAITLKKDALSSIHSDLLDWRDVTKAVSRDMFVTVFLIICALYLRRGRTTKSPK